MRAALLLTRTLLTLAVLLTACDASHAVSSGGTQKPPDEDSSEEDESEDPGKSSPQGSSEADHERDGPHRWPEPDDPDTQDVAEGGTTPTCDPQTGCGYEPRERTYFVSAEEVDWNYAPDGQNVMMGRPFGEVEQVFVRGDGRTRVGSTYRKAVYREYTDESFSVLKLPSAEDNYLGMLGPVIRAVVGDSIKVVFRNLGSHPYSVHPHGVEYAKDSEGAGANDGTPDADKHDDAVMPGETYTYTWRVPERAGPGPSDASSVVWLYHSHVGNGVADEYAGLIGAIIVSDAAHGTESGRASDVERDVVSLFIVDDENQSVLAEENLDLFAPEADPEDEEFEESNLMHSINGYVYANGPRLRLIEGQRVRWHLISLGTEVDLHTPHWHGMTVLERGHRTDVLELLPASMRSVDMVPDNPGTWMFHCHVNDHILAGMSTLYEVVPQDGELATMDETVVPADLDANASAAHGGGV